MKQILLIPVLLCSVITSLGQGLPPLYDNTPKEIQVSRNFVEYPKNTWLENIVRGYDGNFYLTEYPSGTILKVTPSGVKENYAKINGKIAGIARYGVNQFLVTGWDTAGHASVFIVDSHKNTSVFSVIEGGIFPNGIIEFEKNQYLIADSYAGCIWLLNAKDKSVKVWLKDELLARMDEKSQLPGANGLKIYNSHLYISNTGKGMIITVPILNNMAGKPEIYLSGVSADDFAFDKKGNMYCATNVFNRVIKIDTDKKMTVIAELANGAAGATSVVVEMNNSGKTILYVPTCGGMGVPPATGIEEAKILEIEMK